MKDILSQIEMSIQAAEFGRARAYFAQINLKQIPRVHAAAAAALARRAGLISTSLRILNPIVRDARNLLRATESEIASYAFSLHRSGAVHESEKLLAGIGRFQQPESFLYNSIIDISKWNYGAAIPLLKEYVEFESLSNYQRTIGEINLVSAYILEKQLEEASLRLQRLLAQRQQTKLVQGLLLELEVQLYFAKNKYDLVQTKLAQAGRLVEGSLDRVRAWIKQWEIIYQMRVNQKAPAASDVAELNELTWHFNSWELLRGLDLYRIKDQPDYGLHCKLDLGTPYEGFQRRILEYSPYESPLQWVWKSRVCSKRPTRIDLSSGNITLASKSLTMLSPHLLRLLRGVCSDLYRPPKTGALFSALYPNEHFDPFHSPNRVHQAVFRFNDFFKQFRQRFFIKCHNGHYILKTVGDFEIVFHQKTLLKSPARSELEQYRLCAGVSVFRLRDFQQYMRRSKRTAQRLIYQGIQSGIIVKTGSGRQTGYQYTS
jgi:hypothetical protein